MSQLPSSNPGPPSIQPFDPRFSGALPGSPPVLLGADWSAWIELARPILNRAVRAVGLTTRWAAGQTGLGERRTILGRIIEIAENALRGVAGLLVAGSLTLASWFSTTRTTLAAHHVAGTAALLGRRRPDELDGDEQADLADLISRQTNYLDRFRRDIIAARQLLGPGLIARAGMYGAAAWQIATNVLLRKVIRKGRVTEGRRYLGGADNHCSECVAEAARGWVPIRLVTPLGDATCKARCACRLSFR